MLPAALAAAIIVGGSTALLHGGSAEAQVFESLREKQKGQQRQQQRAQRCQLQAGEGQRQYQLSAEECAAVAPVLQAIGAGDWAGAQAALPAAQAAARSADARYVVAQAQLRVGIETNNRQIQAQAIDALIASGGAQPSELPALYENQYQLATEAGDAAKAQQALARLAELRPNDPALILNRVEQRVAQNDHAGALAQLREAFRTLETAGQAVPEAWRKRALAIAYTGRMPQEALALSRELISAHPTPENWRDGLIIFRELGNPDPSLNLDVYRLMRAVGALTSERDYVEYAEAANTGASWGEVKAVLDEGIARNAITGGNLQYARERLATAERRMAEDRPELASQRAEVLAGSESRPVLRLADAYFGYGQYGEAAELYRTALQKGADANLVNTRLGAALALAGQRAEAEAAFRAVTGPRSELANMWLLWLSRRG